MAEQKKVNVVINRIPLDIVGIEGLEELETVQVARQVEERIKKLEDETGMVDTLKLSLLAAVSFASEVYMRQQELESDKLATERSVDEMIKRLDSTLNTKPTAAQ
jgi:cell division protein ZapA (FtsZ GTPase activity inhibitor)